ncbi:amidohydrolase [Anditalea andensis]|uniref:Peptidase M20 n=1 Tax=Anditalea andensis TaxID=1048983 RepID=A0A074L026_9BACT|nr:amidohydrolase [Anditalea andensis]KEO73208.1 peptidase M20 [Anditalea andensis]
MDQSNLKTLIEFRRHLHQYPEISGKEVNTARRVKDFFKSCPPDEIIEGIGGHGIAFTYKGAEDGPTTLIRCELDGLPIYEKNDFVYASKNPGSFHGCGHDGHMAIVAGVGMHLTAHKPKKGKVVLLYQPAEETGEGAAAILNSKRFQNIQPDYAFAIHNLPGFDLNQIILKVGAFAAASKGMIIQLKGKTSHAAHPEAGKSPSEAMCKLIVALPKLPEDIDNFTLLTVVHALLGSEAFGTSPGEATVMATLRAYEDDALNLLTSYAETLARQLAHEYSLEIDISYTESFAATVNHSGAYEIIKTAAKNIGLSMDVLDTPFRWSEDFGQFSKSAKTTIVGLGAGKYLPQLHEPTYDFPDEILEIGISLFIETLKDLNY